MLDRGIIYEMDGSMILSAHQPNFFGSNTFFEKIEKADIFVILQQVQFEKNNYQNRFNKNGHWHTMSVLSGNIPIVQKRYLQPGTDWNYIKSKLKSYPLSQFDDCISDSLATTNISIIRKIAENMGIKTEIALDYPTHLTSTQRIVDLCKHHGADTYLSGPSGKNYLKMELFEAAGISLLFQQPNPSIPIIDILYGKSEQAVI